MPDVLFLPVKQVYAARYLSGEKTAELRRQFVLAERGCRVLIYRTGAEGAAVCLATVDHVSGVTLGPSLDERGKIITDCRVSAPVRPYRDAMALSDDEIIAYLRRERRWKSRPHGSCVFLESVTPLAAPVPLDAIREAMPGFRVPQSYAWLRGDRAEAILRLCGVVPA